VGPRAWQECNVNELTDLGRVDPISGFPVYKALLCEVEKVEAGQSKKIRVDSGEYERPATGHAKVARMSRAHKRIYLDHNATTPIDPEVAEVVKKHLDPSFGNPSSIYAEGRAARDALEGARRSVAQMINSTARRVVFTSGGSEANNLAIKGAAFANHGRKRHIVTTSIEHPSVLKTCGWLERFGFKVTYAGVDRSGIVDPDDIARAITTETCLVSVMTANNETGVIQPIREVAEAARARGVLFHTDAVQAAGKVPVDVEEIGADLLTISGHKVHGPSGAGVLYIRKGLELEPLVHGGSQEAGMRAGTENIAAIAGLGRAAELAVKRLSEMARVSVLRDRLEEALREVAPGMTVNGDVAGRLPNTLNVTLPGFRGEPVVLELDRRGVSLSSGSACRSGSPEPSHALIAMGLSDEEAHCALRFSLGIETTEEEIDAVAGLLSEVISETRNIVRFAPCR
jgi:cysteine desulfurase NifS